jgi:hypothetical protein
MTGRPELVSLIFFFSFFLTKNMGVPELPEEVQVAN